MNNSGQIILVLISILFSSYQKIFDHLPFFSIDFFLFTLIAWVVGWQYDKARYFEKKARASEDSYKKLIDSLPAPVYVTRNHQLVYVNKAALSMIGAVKLEDLMGKSILDFIAPEYRSRMLERFKQIKKEKQPVHTIDYKAKRLDGSTFLFEVSSLLIVFGGKEAILSIGKDITEKIEETERLIQKSEKLALLGQMAAGIAHEIRNPLTSIKGFIQLLKTSTPKEEYFEIVLSELDRINEIVGEFLVLAKPSSAVYMAQDIKILLKDVITLINNQSLLNNIQINVEFNDDLPLISCEENQLKQVFLNLLKNAMEAMPKGGSIRVVVKEKEEGTISVQIIDQGVGIPQERISTLGEPFYTTKEKGTGLGLMTCYKIIEGHN
ncbi:PAS domain S-box protein, partial [Neobacillus drentensis]|uniref:PAS domain S-box protein n=1 Tax=Neobacillus drentensis TaxID=220684 RepID=UPI002FFDA1C3